MTSATSTQLQKSSEVTTSETVDFQVAAHNEQSQPASTLASIELIRAYTPLMLATVGCVIGLFVLVAKPDKDVRTAGFGLASTAIAGAAGLAQHHSGQE